jgi:hypothetical protein
MILTASSIVDLQSCPRKTLLSADYEILHLRPKQLLDACLRKGILAISRGEDVAATVKQMRMEFLQAAANPGMATPTGTDSYKLAMDLCAMLDTILRAAARMGLPHLGEHPGIKLNSGITWQPLAFTSADGLHRIVTIDRWSEADLVRELHSWFVAGDMATTGLDMTIHVIEIGQSRNGRRASAWARGWRNPVMKNANRIRFIHKDGTSFKGWIPVWLADERDLDVDGWVGAMFKEGAAQRLWHTIPVAMPTEAQRAETMRQILGEGARASVLISERGSAPWSSAPMVRAACDGLGVPCGWQGACYGNGNDLVSIGLYIVREKGILRVA